MDRLKSAKIGLLVRYAATVGFLSLAFSPAIAQVGPLQVVEDSNNEILRLYADDIEEADLEISEKVFEVMEQVTSFSTIANDAIVGLCDTSAGDDCDTFKEVFKNLLRVSSVRKLGRYRADSFEYVGEEIDGETAVVRTLAQYGDDEIELDYHLQPIDDSWVITNYVVDGVDTIRNYRKQFTRMLRVSSVDTVIERLRVRTDELEADS